MSWQAALVAIIVGLAVVSLYRHLRAELVGAKPGAKHSCHGCDDCEDDNAVTARVDPSALNKPSTVVNE